MTQSSDFTSSRLKRLLIWARIAVTWEKAWPLLWVMIGSLLLALTLIWLGVFEYKVFQQRAPYPKLIFLVLFSLPCLWALWRVIRISKTTRTDLLRRIDEASGFKHHSLQTMEDQLSLGDQDALSCELWALHHAKNRAAIQHVKPVWASTRIVQKDPYALRFGVLMLAILSLFVAGPEAGSRFKNAFDMISSTAAQKTVFVTGWIDPPSYTGQPPLMIDLTKSEQSLKVPVNSMMVVKGLTSLAWKGMVEVVEPEKTGIQKSLPEEKFILQGNADFSFQEGLFSQKHLNIETISDQPPEISVVTPPQFTLKGTVSFAYKTSDDYGVTHMEAVFKPLNPALYANALVPPPEVVLSVPSQARTGKNIEGGDNPTLNLTDHPWSGEQVVMSVMARDDAAQTGHSPSTPMVLPQRPFSSPLAKALVEQRRLLVLQPEQRRRVQVALDALMIAPEHFTPSPSEFLGLRIASQKLRISQTNEQLLEVANFLWSMAVMIEDGELSEAERNLQSARDQLQKALERGADSSEIKRLSENLRDAMNKYLSEMAQQAQKNQQSQTGAQRNNERMISQDQLNQMMQAVQDALARGDMSEAQRLLEELNNTLDNLKTAQSGQNAGQNGAQQNLSRSLNELDQLMRDQQALQDDTQQQGQESQRELKRRQDQLQQRLENVQKGLKNSPLDQKLGSAVQSMKEAGDALQQDRAGDAVDYQGQALDQMREGAQALAQEMTQQMGQNEGQGQNPGNQTGNQMGESRDPLGRPSRGRSLSQGDVKIPGADQNGFARARQILEELRRKLSDPSRSREELDYFERLIRRE